MMIPVAILTIANDSDRAFMEQLYLKYEKLMHKCAFSVLHDIQDADDAVNDTCIKLIRNIEKLRSLTRYTLRTYIVSTINHAAIDIYRERRRVGNKLFYTDSTEDFISAFSDNAINVEDEILLMLDLEELYAAIDRLAPKDANILKWKYLEELSDREIAHMLGISEVGIRMALSRARKRLAALLSEVNEDDKH